MMDYEQMKSKIRRFITESGISAYDLCRISKDLCCCRTCKFFVQHYAKDGTPVDFGHCRKNNTIKSVRPHSPSCGFWSMDD